VYKAGKNQSGDYFEEEKVPDDSDESPKASSFCPMSATLSFSLPLFLFFLSFVCSSHFFSLSFSLFACRFSSTTTGSAGFVCSMNANTRGTRLRRGYYNNRCTRSPLKVATRRDRARADPLSTRRLEDFHSFAGESSCERASLAMHSSIRAMARMKCN